MLVLRMLNPKGLLAAQDFCRRYEYEGLNKRVRQTSEKRTIMCLLDQEQEKCVELNSYPEFLVVEQLRSHTE